MNAIRVLLTFAVLGLLLTLTGPTGCNDSVGPGGPEFRGTDNGDYKALSAKLYGYWDTYLS